MEHAYDYIINAIVLTLFAIPFLLVFILFMWRRERSRRRELEARFKGVLDVDAEVQRLLRQASEQQSEIEKLREGYREKRSVYDRLLAEISIFDEKLAFAEMGVYEPHFDFGTSDDFKAAIVIIREAQKQLVSSGCAVKELYLTHEYREKLKEEREDRAEVARVAREEQKLLRDLEEAREQEEHYQKLLAKAQAEAAGISGQQLDAFKEQIRILERDLADAHAKVERAQAMAEKTRSGYVYIISNVGSFGEDVVKIGLTRRLDPTDRVRELGDASVPFLFDTHAMIYSENAPGVERSLHEEFERFRVNLKNYRKEFFRVSLDDVEDAVKRLAPEALFFKDIEAQEYYETMARRQDELERAEHKERSLFPETI